MNPFDILNQVGKHVGRELSGELGREIFGGGRRRRGHMGGWGGGGGGLGWVIPAMIIGRIIEEATRQQGRGPQGPINQPWGNPPPSPGPVPSPWGDSQPKAEPVQKMIQCVNCRLEVKEGFEMCPHCGRHVNQRECRYCGRDVPKDQSSCLGCGAPVQRMGDSVLG